MAKQTFTTGQVLTAAQMTSLQQTAMGGGSATAKTTSYVLVAADAGGTVIMNAAGSTTITVNTSLFAAGDTVLIINTGAGTCTVTAGTATVSTAGSLALTQYESGILYFTATGTAIFNDYVQASSNPLTTTGDMIYSSSGSTQARLGIGSTSQVLTVASGIPSWATPSSGALTKITSAPFTTVSSVTVDSVFTSTYTKYLVIVTASNASGGFLGLQFRYGSSTESGANYNNGGFRQKSNNTVANYGVASATQFKIFDELGGALSAGNLYFSSVGNTSEAGRFWGTGVVEDTQSVVLMGGRVGVDRTYTGFILTASTGNISGSYAVYGLAN